MGLVLGFLYSQAAGLCVSFLLDQFWLLGRWTVLEYGLVDGVAGVPVIIVSFVVPQVHSHANYSLTASGRCSVPYGISDLTFISF